MNKVTTRFESTTMLSFFLSLQCWRMIERWRPNTRSLFVLRLTFSLCLSASLFLFASHSHTHSLAAHPFSTHPFLFTIVYHGQRTVSFPVRTHCHHVSENSSACFDTAATSRQFPVHTWAKVWLMNLAKCVHVGWEIFMLYAKQPHMQVQTQSTVCVNIRMITKRLTLNTRRASGVTNWWAVGWHLSVVGKCEQ